jgi:hypothetical protein
MSVSAASKFLEKRIEKTLAKPIPSFLSQSTQSNSHEFYHNETIENKNENTKIADSEVRRYILFYVKNDEPSKEALDKLKKNKALSDDTFVQNAAKLGKRKPWWLDGVPTLFDKSKSSLLKGSSCIEFIEHYKKPVDLFKMPSYYYYIPI